MKAFIAAAAAICITTTAHAAQIEIRSISSFWSVESVVDTRTPGAGALMSGNGTNELRWGESFPGYNVGLTGDAARSGFGFQSISTAPKPSFNANELFNVGVFTHFNRVIFQNQHLDTARLNMTIEAAFDGAVKTFTTSYLFSLLETPNFAQPCANGGVNNLDAQGRVTGRDSTLNVNGCADRVRILKDDAVTESFVHPDNGLTYQFELFGFAQNNVFLGDEFWTVEDRDNHAFLRARFNVTGLPPVSEIPLPAGVWLLLGGLAAFGAVRRRARG